MSFYSSQFFSNCVSTLSYSTHYRNICCVGTFDFNNWYHGGEVNVCKISQEFGRPLIKLLACLDNKIGIHKLVWSEVFKELIATANHDGSITLWNLNETKKIITTLVDKGYNITSIDWNNFNDSSTLILIGSSSSRIKLFDSRNLEYVVEQFGEHTKTIYDIKWNNNNKDEFASVSGDGLVKIWDKRSKNSVNTLLDKEQGMFSVTCCDWHKENDWILAVGNENGQLAIWDTRNDLQPLQRRQAHPSKINSISFDSIETSRIMTGSNDNVLRVWNFSKNQQGVYLSQEHKIHRDFVKTADWNIHNPDLITSAGMDQHLVGIPLSNMTQVKEHEIEGTLVVSYSIIQFLQTHNFTKTEKTRPFSSSKL